MFRNILSELSAARALLAAAASALAAEGHKLAEDVRHGVQRVEAAFGHAEAGAAQDAVSPVSSVPSAAPVEPVEPATPPAAEPTRDAAES